MTTTPSSFELPPRFWDKVAACPNTGCWHWTAGCNRGYGRFWLDGKHHYSHRLAYIEAKGPIPEGLELDHLCRVTNCVNPDHLEAVTGAENVRRSEVGKKNREKTHCLQGHPYAGDNLYISPHGSRVCKACKRVSEAKSRAKPEIKERARIYDEKRRADPVNKEIFRLRSAAYRLAEAERLGIPAFKERQRLYSEKRRENPTYREKKRLADVAYREKPEIKERMRLYSAKRRENPAYREKQRLYQAEFKRKRKAAKI